MTIPLMVLAQAVVLTVTDPQSLTALERRGLSLGRQLDGRAATNGAELVAGAAYRSIVELVAVDLEDLNTGAARSHPGYTGKWRGFDVSWLAADRARFELVTVAHRPDRAHAVEDACGETRLVFRLRYVEGAGAAAVTRGLPMTMSLVYPVAKTADGACPPSAYDAGVAAMADGRATFSRVELNLQSARWPDDEGRRFSEQSHYLMRSLGRGPGGTLVPLPLENQPDVARLAADPALKARFKAWVVDPATRARVERGAFVMPAEFAARRAVSVAPFGLSRGANRPFASALAASDLPIDEPERLLRRLDGFSCVGCHQSRAIAGFHALGEERRPVPDFDRLVTPFSAYFVDVQSWRRAVFEGSGAPAPTPERSGGVFGVCGLEGGKFRDWTCDAGLACRADVAPGAADGVGRCAPKNSGLDGDLCDHGVLVTSADPLADHWRAGDTGACPAAGVCATSQHGFPGGLCASACRGVADGGACIPVPILGPFSACLDRGEAFGRCLAVHSRPTTMPACASVSDCRPDYACIAARGTSTGGVCAPPYFLPQLTVEHQPYL